MPSPGNKASPSSPGSSCPRWNLLQTHTRWTRTAPLPTPCVQLSVVCDMCAHMALSLPTRSPPGTSNLSTERAGRGRHTEREGLAPRCCISTDGQGPTPGDRSWERPAGGCGAPRGWENMQLRVRPGHSRDRRAGRKCQGRGQAQTRTWGWKTLLRVSPCQSPQSRRTKGQASGLSTPPMCVSPDQPWFRSPQDHSHTP